MLRKLVENMSLEKLLDIWEVLAPIKKKLGLSPVHGLIIDEIEARNPYAFDNWLSDDRGLDELRSFMTEWDSNDPTGYLYCGTYYYAKKF